jgi:NAD(P)-dependent dehydrogenase (short-subunit alcohol dehydrogenase family)
MSGVVVVGGTSGIGREFARVRAQRGDDVVITGRDPHRTDTAAKEIGARGLALDLARPKEITDALSDVGAVDHLVIAGVSRDENRVTAYDIDAAVHLVTLKLVGYTAVDSAVVLFGGQAKERPYPGATTVATVNAGVSGLMRTLAVELAPVRVNAIHPGVVGDSPYWRAKPEEVLAGLRARTPTGRLATVADAVDFLLRNGSVNAVELSVDGGWLLG